MPKGNNAAGDNAVLLNVVKPYDFALSLRTFRSFHPALPEKDNTLRLATRIDGTPTLIETSQGPEPKDKLKASAIPEKNKGHIRRIV